MYKKILFGLLLSYSLIGFIFLPFFLKPQVVELLNSKLTTKTSIDSISFNPFLFILEVDGFSLTQDGEKLLSFKKLEFDLELYSLFASTINIKKISLLEPRINLIYLKNKTFNLQNIIKQDDTAAKEDENSQSTMPRVILQSFKVINAGVDYTDFTNPKKFQLSFNRIGFELNNIDTSSNEGDSRLRFYSTLGDGGFLDIKTKILSLSPLEVDGSIAFEASKLYTQWRYIQDKLNLEVADGKLSIEAAYYFNADDLDSTTISSLHVSLQNLRVKPKAQYKDVLRIENFEINDARIKPLKQDVDIKSISLSNLYARVKKNKEGEIDWVDFVKTNFASSEDTNVSKEEKKPSLPWSVKLGKLTLDGIRTDFEDSSVTPRVDTKLNSLNLNINNFVLNSTEPFSYDLDLFVNKNFRCKFDGEVIQSSLDVNSNVTCSGLDIAHYNPYIDKAAQENLKKYDLSLGSAVLGLNGKLRLYDDNASMVSQFSSVNLALQKFEVKKKSTQEVLLKFKSFDVANINLDTKTKAINIDSSSLSNLVVFASRDKNAKLNIDSLVVPKDAKKEAKKNKAIKKKKTQDFRVKLKAFRLKNTQLNFSDENLSTPTRSTLDSLFITLKNIDSKSRTWMKYRVSTKVNAKGRILSTGSLRHTPFKLNNATNIKRISMGEFSPYIEETTYLKLKEGYISLKTKAKYELNKTKPDLVLGGDFSIDEFVLADSRTESYLMSFGNLALADFTYKMNPNRAFVNEVNIEGLYVDALVDEQKRLNFSQLVKPTDINETQNTEKPSEPFPMKIMRVNIKNSSATFADFSLPLKFKTQIHDLNGVVYGISNTAGEISYVDITGEIDEYGSTKLKGSVESSNIKSYTDLDFNFRNLDLKTLSGYSAEFAGYEIDSGKLYLDLGYEIYDSELLGSNSVVIKNIELGAEIEDENSSSLPLGFAIALLEDSDGIIDIDMPVEGNIDNPDFKYGTLVIKTFANLILKAVASPFKFLGAAMGINGEELEYAEFEAGSSALLPPEIEKLDNITKILIKRPKVSISISPRYNKVLDKRALQTQLLIAQVVQKSGIKNKEEYKSVLTLDLLQEIYLEYKTQESLDKILKELEIRYHDGALKIQYQKRLANECLIVQPITDEQLLELAKNRAQSIKDYLVGAKDVAIGKINISEVILVEDEEDEWIKSKIIIEVK